MTMSLRIAARKESDGFRFIMKNQKIDHRRGCTRVRELARLWYRVHQSEVQNTLRTATSGIIERLVRLVVRWLGRFY